MFRAVNKLPTCRSGELIDLRNHYEGDHETLIDKLFRKPPAWTDDDWIQVRNILMHINSTRTSLRTLTAGVYGGITTRGVTGTGPHVEFLDDFVNTVAYKTAAVTLMRQSALYGTSATAPSYDAELQEINFYDLNPVTMHLLVDSINPSEVTAAAEFDEQRNWVRIWHPSFFAILARDPTDVEYLSYDAVEGDVTLELERPFFPVHVTRCEPIPKSPWGLSMLRDTPRFNRNLGTSYFNAAYTARMKAQALLQISAGEGEGDEVNADIQQMGPHTALILPKGAAAQFISNQADVESLLKALNALQELEAYVLGIPSLGSANYMKSEVGKLAAIPLTSQLGSIANEMQKSESELVMLLACIIHWELGDPITPREAKKLYKPSIEIQPAVDLSSLAERTTSYIQLNQAGIVSDEDVVARFNTGKSNAYIRKQAAEVAKRRKAAAPKPAPKPAPTPSSGSTNPDAERESDGSTAPSVP